MSRYKRK